MEMLLLPDLSASMPLIVAGLLHVESSELWDSPDDPSPISGIQGKDHLSRDNLSSKPAQPPVAAASAKEKKKAKKRAKKRHASAYSPAAR